MKPGDIVQLDPEETENEAFRGCLMTVTEVKTWGVQGYVYPAPAGSVTVDGLAFYRATNGRFQPTGGTTVWQRA